MASLAGSSGLVLLGASVILAGCLGGGSAPPVPGGADLGEESGSPDDAVAPAGYNLTLNDSGVTVNRWHACLAGPVETCPGQDRVGAHEEWVLTPSGAVRGVHLNLSWHSDASTESDYAFALTRSVACGEGCAEETDRVEVRGPSPLLLAATDLAWEAGGELRILHHPVPLGAGGAEAWAGVRESFRLIGSVEFAPALPP